MSIYRFRSPDNGENRVSIVDEEQGTYRPPGNAENSNVFKSSSGHDRENMSTRQVATTLGYIHQILFQVSLPEIFKCQNMLRSLFLKSEHVFGFADLCRSCIAHRWCVLVHYLSFSHS